MIEWIFAALTIGGAILNIKKNRWGFVVWTFGSVGWIVTAFTIGLYAQIPVWSFLIFLNIIGFAEWSKGTKKAKTI